MLIWLLAFHHEEAPAQMQTRAAADLERLIRSGFAEAGLTHGRIQTFVTPRRLAALVEAIPTHTAPVDVTRRGPRTSAPSKAIEGFLRSTGAKSIDDLAIISSAKGEHYSFRLHSPGRPAREAIVTIQNDLLSSFPWPKTMRWGSGDLRWIRPLRGLVSLLEDEGGTQEILPFDLETADPAERETLQAKAQMPGHPNLAPEPSPIKPLHDYADHLYRQKVIADASSRQSLIARLVTEAAAEHDLHVEDDPQLRNEVTGLTEWPEALLGHFDPAFLAMPPQIIRAAIRYHQKCFVLLDPKTGDLSNGFVFVADGLRDQGAEVTRGVEKVITARLSDARFFLERDIERSLETMTMTLPGLAFHGTLTMADATEMLVNLSARVAGRLGHRENEALMLAARLCKADLCSDMVGEFPELQGTMGAYYAQRAALPEATVEAIRDQYRPRGPDDDLPRAVDAWCLALSDKLLRLAYFFANEETPTGSRDPFALRRAALGLIRMLIHGFVAPDDTDANRITVPDLSLDDLLADALEVSAPAGDGPDTTHTRRLLKTFLTERIRHLWRDEGHRHDLVEAALKGESADLIPKAHDHLHLLRDRLDNDPDSIVSIKRLFTFLESLEKGKDALPDPRDLSALDAHALSQPEERAFFEVFRGEIAMTPSDFVAMKTVINDLFERLRVNDPDPKVRNQRLALLVGARKKLRAFADFSKVET